MRGLDNRPLDRPVHEEERANAPPNQLVDDDPHLLAVLTAEGYAVDSAPDGETALTTVPGGAYALVILEVVLPGRDGFDVCRELRRLGSEVPILMVTARAELLNKVLGLSLGADDYVTKPFDPRELLARIQALLRRTSLTEYRFGIVHADFLKGKVFRDGRPVNLSAKELQLLRFLIVQRGTTLSREKLLSQVWGYQSAYTRTVVRARSHATPETRGESPGPTSHSHSQAQGLYFPNVGWASGPATTTAAETRPPGNRTDANRNRIRS